jgi:hypothetical protein
MSLPLIRISLRLVVLPHIRFMAKSSAAPDGKGFLANLGRAVVSDQIRDKSSLDAVEALTFSLFF